MEICKRDSYCNHLFLALIIPIIIIIIINTDIKITIAIIIIIIIITTMFIAIMTFSVIRSLACWCWWWSWECWYSGCVSALSAFADIQVLRQSCLWFQTSPHVTQVSHCLKWPKSEEILTDLGISYYFTFYILHTSSYIWKYWQFDITFDVGTILIFWC